LAYLSNPLTNTHLFPTGEAWIFRPGPAWGHPQSVDKNGAFDALEILMIVSATAFIVVGFVYLFRLRTSAGNFAVLAASRRALSC